MKNVMNLTPEEKFHQEVWWILQEIKKEWLATPQGEKVEFSIRQPDKSGVIPPAERQRKLLYKLQEKRLIEIEIGDAFCIVGVDEPKKYLLSINQQRFDKFYKKWEEIDDNPWLSEKSKISQKKKFFERRRKEAEVRVEALRKAFKELSKKQEEKESLKKEIIEEIKKGQRPISEINRPNGKPYTIIRNGKGYFKFYKEGENIEIGRANSRHFRLMQCLCEPHFGIQKTIEAVFEAIKLPKDKSDSDLESWSPQRRTRMLTIIEYAKKELQKNKKLRGKIKYKFDNRKNNMWLELED